MSLGLRARFSRSIAYDPYFLPEGKAKGEPKGRLLVGHGAGGEVYVLNDVENSVVGRVYGRQGKYLRTFLPVPADQVEKAASACGLKLGTTVMVRGPS